MPSSRSRGGAPVYYWDSCVFIHLLQGTKGQILDDLADMARERKIKLVTSTITETEVIKWPKAIEQDSSTDLEISKFFKNEWIIRRSVDPLVAAIARRLRSNHNLKLPDAVHVATAIYYQVDALHSFDRNDLCKKSRKFLGRRRFLSKNMSSVDAEI